MKKRIVQKRITIGLNKQEIKQLDNYCKITGRGYTDVLRECVRNLQLPSQFMSIEKYSEIDE